MENEDRNIKLPVYRRIMTDLNNGKKIEIELTAPRMLKEDEWESTVTIYINGESSFNCEISGIDGFQCFLLSITYLQMRLDHISSNLSFNRFIKGHGLPAYDLSLFNDFSTLKK